MKEVIGFLEQLEQHNDREWFAAHRERYDEARAAFESLGMSPLQLVMLITCIAAMGIIYRLTLEKPPEGLPLGAAEARVGYSVNMSVYIYGILAVAFCWLSLLSNSDVSMFAYFQF